MRISAFNRSCERKQSHIYPSKSLKKVAISFDHDPILFSTANPADEVFGRHRAPPVFKDGLDFDTVDGAVEPPYALPNIRVDYVRHEPPGIPTAFWRSVGPS